MNPALPASDVLMDTLIPVALDLITAVHALNHAAAIDAFAEAAHIAGRDATRELAVLLAGMANEDMPAHISLGWTGDPHLYHQLHGDGVPSVVASLRCHRQPRSRRRTA